MKILDSLLDRIPNTGGFERAVVLDPTDGDSRVSAVLARVPPHHEFPLHMHPHSEDCFFVLSGRGEIIGLDRRFPIAAVAGVWIPAGVPHGLAAGAQGVVEIGFQSPPGPTWSRDEAGFLHSRRDGIVTASISDATELSRTAAEWRSVFEERPGWQYLDPRCCWLETSQRVHAVADGCELLIVVVRGAIELRGTAARVGAVAIIQLIGGESEELCALERDTLLFCIRTAVSQHET